MTAKVFVIIDDQSDPIQIGGTWWDSSDAASDINGGDFWREVQERFPAIKRIKEIRIVLEED